jgi:hypothetical protein
MVDCFDRIAVQMTEIALDPVRSLGQSSTLAAVTLRTPSRGRRYHITIAKLWPAGLDRAPVYSWTIVEVTGRGQPTPGGIQAACADHMHYGDPEDAYWAAVDALADATRGQARA